MQHILTDIGNCAGKLFDVFEVPFEALFFAFIDGNPLLTLWIELRDWVILDDIGTSDSNDSITSMFDAAVAAVLQDDTQPDDRVVRDSRVRFRFGDECSEDVDVDVM